MKPPKNPSDREQEIREQVARALWRASNTPGGADETNSSSTRPCAISDPPARPKCITNLLQQWGPGLPNWAKGQLVLNKLEAGIAWNASRRALGSDHRDPTDSHINERLATQKRSRTSKGIKRPTTFDFELPSRQSSDRSRRLLSGRRPRPPVMHSP
jgi:hypothetical protein